MSVAGKRTIAVAVAELRLGCDLVREAYVGSTGKAADRRDPLYNAALQHDDHRTRQKLEKGWQQGMMQGVRMTCAAREMAAAQPRVVGAREAVASVLGWPRRTGQGAPVLPALLECARCSVQPPPAQRRLRAHVRAALPSGSQADLRGPTAV